MKAVTVTLLAVLFAATTVEAGFKLALPKPKTYLSSGTFRVYETP